MDNFAHTQNTKQTDNIIIYTYCAKCGTRIVRGRGVKDHCDNEFCGKECRKDYHYENKREMDARCREFIGRD